MKQRQRQDGKRVPIVLVVDDNPAIRNGIAWSLQFGVYKLAVGLEAINSTRCFL